METIKVLPTYKGNLEGNYSNHIKVADTETELKRNHDVNSEHQNPSQNQIEHVGSI